LWAAQPDNDQTQEETAMPITVRCVKCEASYVVKEEFAGRQFHCRKPGCNTTLIVREPGQLNTSPSPAPSMGLATPQVKVRSPSVAGPRPEASTPANTVACSHCGGLVTNGPTVAGKVVQCPHCRGQFQMPPLEGALIHSHQLPLVAAATVEQYVTATVATNEYADCPMCGESIKAVAKRCKHCGETLDHVLRRAEEAERFAIHASRSGSVNINNNNNIVVATDTGRRRRTGNVGAAVTMEVLFGFFNIFGIGHFMNGNAGLGLLFMFGYWFLLMVNVALIFVAIGIITLPLTWCCFMVLSPVVVASTPPTYYD
jgi:hypothetical protein